MAVVFQKDMNIWISDFNKFTCNGDNNSNDDDDDAFKEVANIHAFEFANSWPSDVDSISDSNWNVDDDGWNVSHDQLEHWQSFVKKDKLISNTLATIDNFENESVDVDHCQNQPSTLLDKPSCKEDSLIQLQVDVMPAHDFPRKPTQRTMRTSPGAKLRASLPKLLCMSAKHKKSTPYEMSGGAKVPIHSPARGCPAVLKNDVTSPKNPMKDGDSIHPSMMTAASKLGWIHNSDLFGAQIAYMSALNEGRGETTEKEPSVQYNSEEDTSTSTCDTTMSSALNGCVLDPMLAHAFAFCTPDEAMIVAQRFTTPTLVRKLQKVDTVKGAEPETRLTVLMEIDESHFVDVVPARLDSDEEMRISQHVKYDTEHNEPRPSKELVPLMSTANVCNEPLGKLLIVQSKCEKQQQISIDSREPSKTPRLGKDQYVLNTTSRPMDAQKSTKVVQRHKWLQEQAFGRCDGIEKEAQISSQTTKVMDSKVRTVADKFGGAVSRQSVIMQRKQQWEDKWVVKKPHDNTNEKPASKARWEVCNGTYKKKIVLESNQTASE